MIYKDLKRGRITPFYVDGILGNPGKRPYFSYYKVFLKAIFGSNTKAVITLCEVHNHEYAISSTAKNNQIKTFTLQHGDIGKVDGQVVSDKIFAWGQSSNDALLGLGVPEEKIDLSGSLWMEKSYESVIGQKEEIKKYFKEKYNLDFGKPIISFFTNNVSKERWSESIYSKCYKGRGLWELKS
jgi:hypothetical protein